ncbi:MAG TPA: ribosome recycling factor, partial [Petrotogaceae bacterium]|nr:ribosome recycling factor [Petrotogaceae bacterium]
MPAKTAYGKTVQEKLEKTFKHLEEELKGLRTGRPSTAIFENIKVEFYGNPSPINQVGSLNLTEDRTLVITPYDRSMLSKIEKAINASDIGLHA